MRKKKVCRFTFGPSNKPIGWLGCPSVLTDLWETVRAGLKYDQQDSYGDSDLLQLQVVGHPGPPQHLAHAVPGRRSDLTQADGQAVQLRGRQTQTVQQRQGEAA